MSLAMAEGAAVGLVRDAAAGAVGVGHAREHAADPGEHVRERRDVGGVVGIEQHPCVLGVERVAPPPARLRTVDVEQAGDGLLLEPLAGVARRDARPVGELGGRQRPVLGERGVEAELGAEVDGEQLERADGGAEQALGKGVGTIAGGEGHCDLRRRQAPPVSREGLQEGLGENRMHAAECPGGRIGGASGRGP